jgi:hypothetical protein
LHHQSAFFNSLSLPKLMPNLVNVAFGEAANVFVSFSSKQHVGL